MERSTRMERVNEVVHEVVAEELERMSDPRLDLVTVTGVEVTPDLKYARVFYSSLELGEPGADVPDAGADGAGAGEDAHRRDIAEALSGARRYLQHALGRQVRMKYVPRLAFEEDPAILAGRRIDDIIRQLHQQEP